VLSDTLALILSYLYVVLVVGTATVLRSRAILSPEASRKLVHVLVGTWIIPTVVLFRNPWMAIIPPATFIVVNLLSYRFRLIGAMEEGDRNPGTIYFPLAFVLLTILFWPGAVPGLHRTEGPGAIDVDFPFSRFAVPAGIMAMAWGDAAASLFGRRFGRRVFHVPGGGKKSLEGSLAFVVFALLGMITAAVVLLVVPGPGGDPPGLVFSDAMAVATRYQFLPILGAAVAGALAEAVTPLGLDNLTVPLLVAAVTRFLVLA
jgi:phytol kinase